MAGPRTAKFSEACRRLAEVVGPGGLTKAEELAAYCYRRALKRQRSSRGVVLELLRGYAKGRSFDDETNGKRDAVANRSGYDGVGAKDKAGN